jgi:hypothetical protein
MIRSLSIRAVLPLSALLILAVFAGSAVAAPGPLKFSPKKPAVGKKVTVTGKGFKKRAKYKVIVNDVTYKRSYRTSKHGKLKFSFRMPQIAAGTAIFVAAKLGSQFSLAEIFVGDGPPVGKSPVIDCGASPYPPLPDGTCSDWDLTNEIDEDFAEDEG